MPKHEAPGRGGGVDVASQHLQPDTALLQVADQSDDMRQRAADTV
jgi:hypothetical protein